MSLFGSSQIRDRILIEFFVKHGAETHVRELARRLRASPPTVSAELAGLRRLGVLQARYVGRSLVYSINERSPFLSELRSLVQKTIGVEGLIREAVEGLPGVVATYIFGSYAAATDTSQSDVDLLVIGRPDRVLLSDRLARVERVIGRDVNVVTKSEAQLPTRPEPSGSFWRGISGKPMVHVTGRQVSALAGSNLKR
jgi:predicted nucleotidyltransferase